MKLIVGGGAAIPFFLLRSILFDGANVHVEHIVNLNLKPWRAGVFYRCLAKLAGLWFVELFC